MSTAKENKSLKNGQKDADRDDKGKFLEGHTPKSPGRPVIPQEIKDMCRGYSVDAIKTAISVMLNKKAQSKDRLKAVEIILDRGYGKAAQAIIGGEEGDKPVKLTVEGIVELLKGDKQT